MDISDFPRNNFSMTIYGKLSGTRQNDIVVRETIFVSATGLVRARAPYTCVRFSVFHTSDGRKIYFSQQFDSTPSVRLLWQAHVSPYALSFGSRARCRRCPRDVDICCRLPTHNTAPDERYSHSEYRNGECRAAYDG